MNETTYDFNGGKCSIMLGEKLSNLPRHLPKDAHVAVLVDKRVASLHGASLAGIEAFEIEASEANKNLQTVQQAYDFFMQQKLDRSSFVVCIGGGIVLDIGGFAASTYLRGIKFAYAPTTLLSQADASIGGKTGVNLAGYKNQIGTFAQPTFILDDISVLSTLPAEQVRNGFAEIIKHAAIADSSLFEILSERKKEALALDKEVIEEILKHSIRVKTGIVLKDEHEAGERKLLNFGHTIGHAIEKAGGLPHGEAVAIGMAFAARLSSRKGMLPSPQCDKLIQLISDYGLPTTLDIDTGELMDAIEHDKKRQSRDINLVLLEGMGKSKTVSITLESLKREINDLH